MRDHFVFIRRGRRVVVRDLRPTTMLLDWLRLVEHATGVKEGCAEGDCGACTVVLARKDGDRIVHEPVCACITLVGQADGAEVITVEDIGTPDAMHGVQAEMVTHHGSQCGYCTPGIVMSLFALYHDEPRPVTRDTVLDALAGNLCRCTGYRPIVDAALAATRAAPSDRFTEAAAQRAAQLSAIASSEDILVGDVTQFFAAPASEDALAALLAAHPDATIVAGNTDVALWINKAFRDLPKIIWLGRVHGLDAITEDSATLTFGATVTHARALPSLAAIDPDLGEVMRRFASRQIRATGTIGGSIANGSPIGDLAPALIALGAVIELRLGDVRRQIALEDFFLDYRRQDRQPGEFVRAVSVSRLGANDVFRAYKVSKRFDEDISAVLGAFRFTVEDGVIAAARIAYGGMAGTPKRASGAEAALTGIRLHDRNAWVPALAALSADFRPMSDHRASAGYRAAVARNLLTKALAEVAIGSSLATRLHPRREASLASL